MVRLAADLRVFAILAVGSLMLAFFWRGIGVPAIAPASIPVSFYQHVIGNLDGRSCPSYPVCSLYAREAVAEYGLWLGSWIALDRLIHEADDLQRGPWLVFKGETRLDDSLTRNTSWLQGRNKLTDTQQGE